MPYPPPAIFQFILCLGVASSSLGYQVRGTVIVRPSFRATLRAESVNETSATLSSAPSAKIPMPSFQELLLVLHYDAILHDAILHTFMPVWTLLRLLRITGWSRHLCLR